MWRTTLTATALAMIAGAAGATSSIETLGGQSGEATPWGLGQTPVYGQVLTLTHDSELKEFLFRAKDGGTPISFRVTVQAWEGEAATGPVLTTGEGETAGSVGYETVQSDIDDVEVPAGTYVVLVEATSPGQASFATSNDGYRAGAWVYRVTADDGTESWYVDRSNDLAFRLTYDEAE